MSVPGIHERPTALQEHPIRPEMGTAFRVVVGTIGALLVLWWAAYTSFSLLHFMLVWQHPSNIFNMAFEYVAPFAAAAYLLLVAAAGRWDTKTAPAIRRRQPTPRRW